VIKELKYEVANRDNRTQSEGSKYLLIKVLANLLYHDLPTRIKLNWRLAI
jgi:hypothetical protein